MKSPSFLLLILFCISSVQALQDLTAEKEKRPISFVSDPSNWLSVETRESLELFLRARSNDRGVDVFVLLTSSPSPHQSQSRTSLEKLGNSWSQKSWAIISYDPKKIATPVVVTGGPFQKEVNLEFWKKELLLLQDLSNQSWFKQPDINFLAREISDSITFFARSKNATIELITQNRNQLKDKNQQTLGSRKALLITIAIGSLIALALCAFLCRRLYLSRREMLFPQTTWRSRLGAPHSGGSAVKHRFRPPRA